MKDNCPFDFIWNPDEETPLSIRSDKLRVDWYNAGEGICGDYNPDDPDDVNYLRFDVYCRPQDEDSMEAIDGWIAVEDASYCTLMPADAGEDTLLRSLTYIFSRYCLEIANYPTQSLKKLGEELSWISPVDFDPICTN